MHRWRAETDAVAIGIGTALADDPLLTARTPYAARQPTRIVFDSAARLPLDSKLVGSVSEAPLLVVVAPDAPRDRTRTLERAGAELVVVAGSRADRVRAALAQLGGRGLSSVLLEGGPILAGAFLEAGEVDGLRLFFAPRVLGGGRSLIEGAGVERIAQARPALAVEWERVDEDLLLRARLREW